MTPTPVPPLGPDDADDSALAGLLGDALRRGVDGPVDGHRLVAGARRGAVRIRRRRTVGVAVLAAVVLVGAPVGVLRLNSAQQTTYATSAKSDSAGSAPAAARSGDLQPEAAPAAGGADSSASAVAGPAGAVQSGSPGPSAAAVAAPGSTSPGVPPTPGLALPSPSARSGPALQRTAGGQVVVPDAALLAAADVPQVALTRTTDGADRTPAPATPPATTCRVALAVPAAAAGSRSVNYGQPAGANSAGANSAGWQLTTTVRVYPGTGATDYLAAAAALPCANGVRPAYGDGAITTKGVRDAQGRTHYYAVVRVGRVVSEVVLVVPGPSAAGSTELVRLLGVAAGRLVSSGLAPAAAGDPGLGP